jgi:acetyl esterase/lipase
MKKMMSLALVFLFTGFVFGLAQEDTQEFSSYQEMRSYLGELFKQKKYEEAAQLLERVKDSYPDHTLSNSFNLAVCRVLLKDNDKAVEALEFAHEKDQWFNIYTFRQSLWDPLRDDKDFQKILARNEELRAEAQKTAKPDLQIVTPGEYDPEKKYPLFISLHGGGENIAHFRNVWTSPLLSGEFITAYLQSSQIVAMNGFSWTEDLEIAKKEILTAYQNIIRNFSIDPKEVYVGGFSSGGIAALEVVLANVIPAAGFVALCPAKMESCTPENVRGASERGVRGTIITSEFDGRVPEQREMAEIFRKEGLQYQFILTPNIGHWIPKDLGDKIDQAIRHIRYK